MFLFFGGVILQIVKREAGRDIKCGFFNDRGIAITHYFLLTLLIGSSATVKRNNRCNEWCQ